MVLVASTMEDTSGGGASGDIRRTMMDVREAYRQRDVSASLAAHRSRERHKTGGDYLGELVLGGIDGIITTFAVVAGVVGAQLSAGIILILGFANLIADGFSMAVGNFLGARSSDEYEKTERSRETWEVENLPDAERQEIREIFAAKGFSGDLLDSVVDHVTSNKELWVETMMREELNIIQGKTNPYLVGIATLVAFLSFGSIPLLLYLISFLFNVTIENIFPWTAGLTAVALFLVGVLRSRFTFEVWWRSGVEILLVGGLAGGLAYACGVILKGIIPV